MIKTVEAIVDEKGNVKLLEQVRLGVPRRALVTILDEKPAARVSETALLSGATLPGLLFLVRFGVFAVPSVPGKAIATRFSPTGLSL